MLAGAVKQFVKRVIYYTRLNWIEPALKYYKRRKLVQQMKKSMTFATQINITNFVFPTLILNFMRLGHLIHDKIFIEQLQVEVLYHK